ncbi:hypothetical protein EDD86DRAFT_193299 [Gorgonomyces haynaldii]|nr:hypothetical protein EDD86DRAFT_193299 [Gorgonomyces haynaldii]
MSIQPPIGRIFIAAALNASSSDSLKLLNERTNISWSALHLTQPIPVQGNYPDIGSLDDTETDAILYLTLEPTISLNLISTDEWKLLVTQCVSLNSKGRRVLLRLAPEMNAYWRSWGLKPTQFKKTWSTVHALLKKETNNTDLVWSPAQGAGYPFSQNVTNRMSLDDLAALDTNKDGKIDSQDDPYMPFYPGDDLVDWVGLYIV